MNEKVRAFLQEKRFAVLATVRDGIPQQTVMWYELQGDEILINTAKDRVNYRNIEANHRISICVEDGYAYVTLVGTASLIGDQSVAQEDIRRLAIRYHGEERGNQMSRDQFRKQERVTIRMRIEHVVARGI